MRLKNSPVTTVPVLDVSVSSRRFGAHIDALGEGSQLHGCVDRQRGADAQFNVVADETFEARRLDADPIVARAEERQPVQSFRVGGRLGVEIRRHVGGSDLGIGDRRARAVHNRAGQRGGVLGQSGDDRNEQHDEGVQTSLKHRIPPLGMRQSDARQSFGALGKDSITARRAGPVSGRIFRTELSNRG